MVQQFILGFLFITLINACSAQKNITMKTFDIETFNKNKDGLNRRSYIDEDDFIIKQSDDEYEYYETIKHKDSFIQTINRYYKSGQLKMTVKDFPNNFLAGVKKEFDEQGNLIKETDYDAPYKFTWEDILKLIEERELNMNDEQFEILRGSDEKSASWTIVFEQKGVYDKLSVINIDGVTGEITREAEIDYPTGGEYETLPNMEDE